jgi:hypothetical protein
MLCNISFDGFAVALSVREVLACERASELTFNPLAPILGGKSGNWGTSLILRRVYDQTLGIRLRRTAPLRLFVIPQDGTSVSGGMGARGLKTPI